MRFPWSRPTSAPTPPNRIPIGTKSFIFPTTEAAQAFQSSLGSSRRGYFDWVQSPYLAADYGGTMTRSTSGRELSVYGRAPAIRIEDCRYLADRDPTASMLVSKAAKDAWNALPTTYIQPIDSWFAYLETIGLPAAAAKAQRAANVDGIAYLLNVSPGRPGTRLKRGDIPTSFHVITVDNLAPPDDPSFSPLYAEGPASQDPLIRDHGILSCYYWPTAERNTDPIEVHGSRLLQFRGTDSYESILKPIFDDLQDLRDILFSRTRAHFQGDPIVVEVDLSSDTNTVLDWASMSSEDRKQMAIDAEDAIRAYNHGSKSTFAPVMGFKLKRLGAANLPDPKEDIAALVGRIANGSPFPARMLQSTTKGSTSVEDQDLILYGANINNERYHCVYPKLSKLDTVARVTGFIPARSPALPRPVEIEWPLIRPLTPRDASFIEKSEYLMAQGSWQMSLSPPPRIARKFPQDPSVPVPPWLAKAGRKRDGTSADPTGVSQSNSQPDEESIAQAVASQIIEYMEDSKEEP